LTRFPVATPHKFGLHWRATPCGDVESREYLHAKFQQYHSWGACWLKLCTSPGGDDGYLGKELGCSEWAFAAAMQCGLQPVLRIFASTWPAYWTSEREVMLKRFRDLTLRFIDLQPERYQPYDFLFAIEPANEVDVLSEESGGGRPSPQAVAAAFGVFAEKCRPLGSNLCSHRSATAARARITSPPAVKSVCSMCSSTPVSPSIPTLAPSRSNLCGHIIPS